MNATHYIKARKRGEKGWWFVSSDGKMNRLRVHALRYFAHTVNEAVATLATDNPEYDFKAVPIQ